MLKVFTLFQHIYVCLAAIAPSGPFAIVYYTICKSQTKLYFVIKIQKRENQNNHTKLQCCSIYRYFTSFSEYQIQNEIFNLIFMLMGLVYTKWKFNITLNCCGWYIIVQYIMYNLTISYLFSDGYNKVRSFISLLINISHFRNKPTQMVYIVVFTY